MGRLVSGHVSEDCGPARSGAGAGRRRVQGDRLGPCPRSRSGSDRHGRSAAAVPRDRRRPGHASGVLPRPRGSRLRPVLRRRRPESADHRRQQQPAGHRRLSGHRSARRDRAPAELPQPLSSGQTGKGVLLRRSRESASRAAGAGSGNGATSLLLRAGQAGRGCARYLASGRPGPPPVDRRHRAEQPSQGALRGSASIRGGPARQPPGRPSRRTIGSIGPRSPSTKAAS